MNEFASYSGDDLEIFQHATNWKLYFQRQITPFLGQRVLEVGAGIGGTTARLFVQGTDLWICLEPDATLARRLEERISEGSLPAGCEIKKGDLRDLDSNMKFDAVVYIDVLEHIDNDRGEIALAATKLSTGGHLVVLSPAHQWVFSALDVAVGHFRRYSESTLADLAPKGMSPVRVRYLDSIGLLASLGNRLILRSSLPTQRQTLIWDRFMVPMSRLIDPMLGYRVGKSILAIWKKTAEQ